MPFAALPDELLVHMCVFLCVATLARLRETCSQWRTIADNEQSWTNALFTYGDAWYQLKNVALAAKYMRCSHCIPRAVPSLDTLDNVALFGTIVDGERLLATFGPKLFTFTTDFDRMLNGAGAFIWADTSIVHWETSELRKEFVAANTADRLNVNDAPNSPEIRRRFANYWLKTASVDVYALVLSNGVAGMHRVVSDIVDIVNEPYSCPVGFNMSSMEGGYFEVYTDELVLEIWEDVNTPSALVPDEWEKEYIAADKNKRLRMATRFAENQVNTGKGWGSTRRFLIEQFMSQLHPRFNL